MINPAPIQEFSARILKGQHKLRHQLNKPRVDLLSVMLLSQPIREFNDDTLIMEFFGVFWVFSVHHNTTGFFDSEEDAVQYVQERLALSG